MARILTYGCTSSVGSTVEHYWSSLIQGKENPLAEWKVSLPQNAKKQSNLTILTEQLLKAWIQARPAYDRDLSLGVILASTKGCIDDFIWDENLSPEKLQHDPLSPVLNHFLKIAELNPEVSICVSNACASTLAALQVGESWLKQKRVEQVLVLACDRLGEFVFKGFQSLHALTQSTPRPFSKARDGLKLGEAATAILLGNDDRTDENTILIRGMGLNTEGYAVTRPSPSGESLKRAYQQIQNKHRPDLIIAHGTGTLLNDAAEDQCFSDLFGEKSIPITGTKWCVGHTLAASAAMDIIAACEVLKSGQAFSLATTLESDPQLKGNYLHRNASLIIPNGISTVLVSSLGFGGIHAMAELCK